MPNRRVEIPKGNGKVPNASDSLHPRSRGAGALKLILEADLRGGLLLELLRVSPEAVAASSPGGSQAQCDAADVRRSSMSIWSRYFDTIRHSVLLEQDREADSGPTSPAPREADHQGRRKDRCPARGTVQPAGGEHLPERGRLVLRRDSPQDGRRALRGGQLSSVRR